ncbi:RidA family protein [Tenacibaculum ovolyticum]|uniref:RidA family protein n=1 Tax=Tenacibaculum ovolyticum TaxID=104270 RepID=UPI003BAD9688
MKIITSLEIPKNMGHYAICTEHNGVLYLSGQIPVDQSTGTVSGSIKEQTLLLLQNIERTLIAAGSDKNHILKNEVFLKDYRRLVNSK